MKTIELNRTGLPPLRFEGELIADATSEEETVLRFRFHDIEVFRTKAGRIVVYVVFHSDWPHEPHAEAFLVDRPEDIPLVLTKYAPTSSIIGHPPGARDGEKKNRQIKATVSAGWATALAKVLDKLKLVEVIS